MICGIDEAGRGPVLGPLVMAICCAQDDAELKMIGVKDSKLLTPDQREDMARKIKRTCVCKIIKASPKEIDDAINSPDSNLNKLEEEMMVKLIISTAKEGDTIIIDAPMLDTDKFKEFIEERLKGRYNSRAL